LSCWTKPLTIEAGGIYGKWRGINIKSNYLYPKSIWIYQVLLRREINHSNRGGL